MAISQLAIERAGGGRLCPTGDPPAMILGSVDKSGCAVIRRRPARRDAEAGDHLVKNQQDAMPARQFAQGGEEGGRVRAAVFRAPCQSQTRQTAAGELISAYGVTASLTNQRLF